MSGGQYTPGPWRVEAGTYSGYESDSIATVYCVERMPTKDGLGIDHCTIVGGPRSDLDRFHATQTANARLIAAAPEMLEALEVALGDVLYLANERGELDRFQGTIDQCSAAIAKAKGEAC